MRVRIHTSNNNYSAPIFSFYLPPMSPRFPAPSPPPTPRLVVPSVVCLLLRRFSSLICKCRISAPSTTNESVHECDWHDDVFALITSRMSAVDSITCRSVGDTRGMLQHLHVSPGKKCRGAGDNLLAPAVCRCSIANGEVRQETTRFTRHRFVVRMHIGTCANECGLTILLRMISPDLSV